MHGTTNIKNLVGCLHRCTKMMHGYTDINFLKITNVYVISFFI